MINSGEMLTTVKLLWDDDIVLWQQMMKCFLSGALQFVNPAILKLKVKSKEELNDNLKTMLLRNKYYHQAFELSLSESLLE